MAAERARASRSTLAARLDSAAGARLLLAAGTLAATVLWLRIGGQRWFLADDWSYVLYRDPWHTDDVGQALFMSMNGHPVTVSAVQFSATSAVWGGGSYLPYVLAPIALHLACAGVLWVWMRRIGVAELTAAGVTLTVMLLGPSAEFPVFASITNFQYSLLGLLLVLLIVDRSPDGTPWLVLAAALGVLATLSSSFGAMFALAPMGVLLAGRRWRSAAIVTVPPLVVYGWWWLAWGRGTSDGGSAGFDAPRYAVTVIGRTFDALAAPQLGGVALAATCVFGVALCPRGAGLRLVWPLAGVAVLTAAVLGVARAGYGTDDTAVGRYVVVLAFLLAPAYALAIEQLRRWGRPALLAGVALLGATIAVNVADWRETQRYLVAATEDDRLALELVAGADLSGVAPDWRPSLCSPDIVLFHLPGLIERGFLTPRQPESAADEALLAAMLGEPVSPDPRPCSTDYVP